MYDYCLPWTTELHTFDHNFIAFGNIVKNICGYFSNTLELRKIKSLDRQILSACSHTAAVGNFPFWFFGVIQVIQFSRIQIFGILRAYSIAIKLYIHIHTLLCMSTITYNLYGMYINRVCRWMLAKVVLVCMYARA